MSDPRFPVDIRLIGVMRKEKSKLYITSVLWSDKSEVIVYRSLQDYKRLHRQLKKKFLAEKTGKEYRVLPHFGARNTKRTFPLKGLVKSVHHLSDLEKYCSSLLRCDTAVSHSSEVIQFLLPNEQELQPEFTQNSLMILQSDNIPTVMRGPDMANKCLSIGNVTHPFVSKTYRCVAPYETKDTKNKPFKVAVDERLDVLIKDQAGWWLVENEDKRLAWFPAPYLGLCDEEEDEDEINSATVEMPLYCATRGYTSKKEDELSLSIGAVVEVLQKSLNGWWLVRYNNKAGYVPSMFLTPYCSLNFGFQNLQRKLNSSTINLSASNSFKQDANSTEPQVNPQYIINNFHKSHSLEVMSEPRSQYSAPEDEEHEESDSLKNSFHNDSINFSFSSSDTDSMSTSMSSSDGEEGMRHHGKEPDGNKSGISSGQSSPTTSETGDPIKAATCPRVPPRPHTQEILNRCTTYTRKAALATTSRLFPERACLVDGGRVQKACESVHCKINVW